MLYSPPAEHPKRPCRRRVRYAAVYVVGLLPLLMPQPAESLLLNFRNVEIRQIIESVGELTGKNFIIDPRVRGKVTILANEEVPEEALYDVMLSILRMYGFRAVEGENMTRILPGNIATRFKPEFLDGAAVGDSDRLVTTILSIRHLNAASVIPMIKPLMTPEAQVLLHKETNKLLITEVNANLERVTRVISKIDVADVGDFEVINLDYASAKDLVGLLQRASNKNLRHLTQVVADQTGNRIILTGPSQARRSLRALIAELDSETSTASSARIQVIPLYYARAEDVEKIVKGLLSSAELIKTLGTDELVADSKASDAQQAEQPAAGEAQQANQPTEANKAEVKQTPASGKRNYVVQVDKALNALIVGGPPKVIAAVERVVREIDVPRPQVLIEAIFADTSQEKALDLGTRLTGGKQIDSSDSSLNSPSEIVQGIAAVFEGRSVEGSDFALVGQASFDGNIINFLVTALQTDEDSRVLSTPSIMTMNNEEATIDVSNVISIRTGRTTSDSGSASTFDRQEFGTTLKVKPQITEGAAVRLDIEYKTEDVLPTRSGGVSGQGETADPDSRKREIKTTVLVNDGDILVLGGLSREQATEDQSEVPLLSKIPVLGHLFKSRTSARDKTTLMVFIRPTILRNAEEGSQTSRERYAALRLEQLMDAQDAETLLPKEDPMVLPNLLRDRQQGGEARQGKPVKKRVIQRKPRRDPRRASDATLPRQRQSNPPRRGEGAALPRPRQSGAPRREIRRDTSGDLRRDSGPNPGAASFLLP